MKIEVVFGLDRTGSMFAIIALVKRLIVETTRRLFREIPDLRIGFIHHADYCDARPRGEINTSVIDVLDLTNDQSKICRWVQRVESAGGGDEPECYELELNYARTKISWTAGAVKVFVMVGDEVPHGPGEAQNILHLDWKNELKLLLEAGVHVYGVQARNEPHATRFYDVVARMTNGFHIRLDQFRLIEQLILAVCFKQAGDPQLERYEREVEKQGRMTRGADDMFGTLLNRTARRYSASRFTPVEPGRFQVLSVDEDCSIREFVELNGFRFEKGRGFYELNKAETIQDYKEIVIVDRVTGDMFTGKENIRSLLGIPSLPPGSREKIRLSTLSGLEKYRVFVQSKSVNRKLQAGTTFLYDIQGL